jgi:hypothetical protein
MSRYDPLKAPDSKQWLELDEQERIILVESYHKKARVVLPNHIMHASMHAVVENQLAEGLPVVQETLSRLMADGLDRHDAIHAIASVLAGHIWHLLQKTTRATRQASGTFRRFGFSPWPIG